jgi:tripartite-type tricarboxylate transporter receptor subunit TctC
MGLVGSMKFSSQCSSGLAACAAAVIAVVATALGAQSQPAGTTKFIVPFPAGGSSDTLARLLADHIGRARGSAPIVENRPGAGAIIGYEAASRAAPDGNTLLINAPSFVINPHLRKVNYEPLTQFEPICYLVRLPLVITVSSGSPYQTLADLLDVARKRPGELTLASGGTGTIQHIALEMLKRSAKVNITFVPYSGNPAAVNALLGGHVAAVISNYENIIDQVNAGKLRALATASATRIETLPQVPTVSEAGYKDYEADNWFGLMAPAKTPNKLVTQFAEWAKAAMQAPEVRAKLVNLALYPVGMCGAQFAVHLRNEHENYGRLIRQAKITGQ